MSVTNVEISGVGIGGTATGVLGTSRSYDAKFLVTVDTTPPTPVEVFLHFQFTSDLPWPGRTFNLGGAYDLLSACKTIRVDYVERSGGQFIVSANYEPIQGPDEQGQQPNGQPSSNPLLWADEIDVSFTPISIPVEAGQFRGFDGAGNISNNFLQPLQLAPIVNSAIKPFDPTLEDEAQIKVIRISKYASRSAGDAMSAYIGAINESNVLIDKPLYRYREFIGPYRALINGLSEQFGITNGIPYWKQTIEVHRSPLLYGWFRPIVDRGLDARRFYGDPDGHGGTIGIDDGVTPGTVHHEAITDKNGVPITEPVLLNGNGQPLQAGQPPVYMVYNLRKIMSFSAIRW